MTKMSVVMYDKISVVLYDKNVSCEAFESDNQLKIPPPRPRWTYKSAKSFTVTQSFIYKLRI